MTYKIPTMIVANNRNYNANNNEADLLHEIKPSIGECNVNFKNKANFLLGISIRAYIIYLSCNLEIKVLSELTSPSNQFKSMIEYTARLYSLEIPKKVISNSQEQIEGLTSEEINSFLRLV
ncbi:1317_t:CDS:2, partial [Racocetra fulgida]